MNHQSKLHIGARTLGNLLLILEQGLGHRFFNLVFRRVKTALYRFLEPNGSVVPTTKPSVERRTDLSPKEFHAKYFSDSLPVVFSGAARDWPCCRNWTLEYFKRQYPDQDVLLVNSNGLTSREAHSQHEFLTVTELINNIRAGGEKYLRFSPLIHQNPELASALDLPWLKSMRGGGTFANTYYMFMGGAQKKTLLHADQPCNLFVQISGRKKWTFFLPSDSLCLYPEVTNTAYVKSPVDIDQPDIKKFPLFQLAQVYEAILEPGDVLYVPPHVWHQVENLSDSIAVGYRFSSFTAAIKSSMTFSLLRLLSTNPPFWKTRRYGKVDTNLIWAHAGGKIKEVLNQREARRQMRKNLSPSSVQRSKASQS